MYIIQFLMSTRLLEDVFDDQLLTIFSGAIFELSNLCSSLDGIWSWTHTIDALQHHSLSLMSSALDHSTTSSILKYSFNSRSDTLSRKENLEIDIRHVIIWQQSSSAIFNILYRVMMNSLYSHRKKRLLYKHLSRWQSYDISVPLDLKVNVILG